MNAAQVHRLEKAGTLLTHVASLDRQADGRPPASARLEQVLGRDLAARLLTALAGDHRTRPRGL